MAPGREERPDDDGVGRPAGVADVEPVHPGPEPADDALDRDDLPAGPQLVDEPGDARGRQRSRLLLRDLGRDVAHRTTVTW